MKSCFITYDGLTDPLGSSQILPYVEGLVAAGHRMWLISFEKPDRFATQGAAVADYCRRVGITWLPQVYHKRPPVLSTLLDLWAMRRMLRRLHRAEKLELLHCRSYLPMLVALPLKRSTGVKVLFDMRGFWADERVDGGLWPQSNPLYRAIYRFFKRHEAHFFRQADAMVSLTHAGKALIQGWLAGEACPPIEVIPCSADFAHFTLPTEQSRLEARAKLDLSPDSLVVGYLGALGTWYRLPEMLRFFQLAESAYPGARFLILTPETPEWVAEQARAHGVNPNALVVRFVPRAEVPHLMAAADVGLNFILPSFSKQASSPTKLGELLAMGIPVLSNAGVGDVAAITQTTGGGWMLPDLSEASLQQAVAQLPRLLSADRAGIRERAFAIYDLARARHTYAELYRRLSAGLPH